MSTMHPVMVFNKKGELSLITGSPGGSQIPAANLRVVTGVIDFDLHVGDATMLPRIHKDWPYADLDFESTVSQDNLNLYTELVINLSYQILSAAHNQFRSLMESIMVLLI